MTYGDKYDDDDYDDNDNLDVLLTDILILSCICYAMLFLSILFYYSAILATTSINACLLARYWSKITIFDLFLTFPLWRPVRIFS